MMGRHSSIFGVKHALRPHSVPREVEDLRNDIEDTFLEMETRGVLVTRVRDFYDASRALPVNPSDGDRYICSASGNGWTTNRIYTYNGQDGHEEWVETSPAIGLLSVVDSEPLAVYIYATQGGMLPPSWATISDSALARLASTEEGEGASLVGVEDPDDLFDGDTVEECLAEIPALTAQDVIDAEAAKDAALAAQGLAEAARDNAEAAANDAGTILDFGYNLSTNLTDHDTIVIGDDVYEFLSSAGNKTVTADQNIAVVIGGNSSDTRDNWLLAINATYAGDHPTCFKKDGLTPALANGTKNLLASLPLGALVLFLNADKPGGTATPGSQSLVLLDPNQQPNNGWTYGAINTNTLPGKAPVATKSSMAVVTITTAMINNGWKDVFFPFNIEGVVHSATRISVPVTDWGADYVAVLTNNVRIGLGGLGGLQNGDMVTLLARGPAAA